MERLAFIAEFTAALWKNHGVIATDGDEELAVEYWRTDNHVCPIEVARIIANDTYLL